MASFVENRTYSGRHNNRLLPDRGRAGQQLLRLTTPAYVAGARPSGGDRPNPREISNIVCSQPASTPHDELTDAVWAWGQFLDHELDLTPETPDEDFDIPVAKRDPALPGGGRIPFRRSVFDLATGHSVTNPRQQVNLLSSYVDAANVYGANSTRAAALRTFEDGKLKVATSKHGDLLPKNTAGLPNAPGPENRFFLAGDIRANEHVILTSLHTLFVREHNRLCDEIVAERPSLAGRDEAIYQKARKFVGAIMQVITYREFLPALLGTRAIAPYRGYNPASDAGISNIFSTASYRLGHSMVSPGLLRVKADGSSTSLDLKRSFFDPRHVTRDGIEVYLRGLTKQRMQVVDTRIVDGLRTFLFGPPDPTAREMLDLGALNIQRGRDHGLPSYNRCRRDFGLAPRTSFAAITSDADLADRLRAAYGSVDLIDPWVGGLAENLVRGAQVGELIWVVLKDQFERLRDGDRFWYQNDPALRRKRPALRRTRLRDVIERNTGITGLQDDVFRV